MQNYYPFGGDMGDTTMNYTTAPNNLYKYSGKELQTQLNLDSYDFGARHFDPRLGRWMTMDPLGITSEELSPYNYVENNPMNLIDPDGMQPSNGNWQGVPYAGGGSGGFWGSAGGIGGALASGGFSYSNASKGFDVSKSQVTTQSWSGVQANKMSAASPTKSIDAFVGGFVDDAQESWQNLKSFMRQDPAETIIALDKGLKDGTIKQALIHSVVKNVVKFSTGSKNTRWAVLGAFASQLLQLGLPEGELGKMGEVGEIAKFEKIAKSGETTSTALGRKMHKLYKAEAVDGINSFKEFNGVKGIRPDFVNFETKTIYELKPNNPRAINQGIKQLAKYKLLFEKHYGGVWKTVLDTYK